MPKSLFFLGLNKKNLKFFTFTILCIYITGTGCVPKSFSPIEPESVYYVRYDTFIVSHKAVRENLIMVPAYEEFRVEKFEPVNISCAINLSSKDQKKEVRSKAINKAIKQILESRGLIYVTTLNNTTVISYEGIVKTPFHVQPQQSKQNSKNTIASDKFFPFLCSTKFDFSPLSFPNQWSRQQHMNNLKNTLTEIWGILK